MVKCKGVIPSVSKKNFFVTKIMSHCSNQALWVKSIIYSKVTLQYQVQQISNLGSYVGLGCAGF